MNNYWQVLIYPTPYSTRPERTNVLADTRRQALAMAEQDLHHRKIAYDHLTLRRSVPLRNGEPMDGTIQVWVYGEHGWDMYPYTYPSALPIPVVDGLTGRGHMLAASRED